MAVEDDMMEGSISSLIQDSLEPKRSGDMLSPEDVAWVNSCLIKDPEISDSGWNSLKEALLEIVNSLPESFDSAATGNESFPTGIDIEMISSSHESETVQFPGRADYYLVPITEETQDISADLPINQMINTLHPQIIVGNDFLPNFIDGLKEGQNIDSGLDLGFPAYEMEALTDDIFRVWDLDVPAEEDELVKQLNKALTDGSFQSVSSTSRALKDLKTESFDDLVAGIADLSLNQNSV